MQLPEGYIRYTRTIMGEDLFARYLHGLEGESPVSIRLNPLKTAGYTVADSDGRVAWCADGYYLQSRPNFTFDPLLHAGCYYVQEAASMFLDTVLRQHLPPHPVTMLDLCAAPGGKSTLARAALPEGSVLYANEPVRQRAHILSENMTKWGWPDCIVTNNYPRDYRHSKLLFDVILCDVPCSGEGMFRKDPATIGEWSVQNVERCWQLQRDIVSDIWGNLRDGGLLIYSTCTFNTKENEENIRWLLHEFADAEVLPVATQAEWNITGSLLDGFNEPVYRFIPGVSRGEGLFVCVLHKSLHIKEDTEGIRGDKREGRGRSSTSKSSPLNTLLSPHSSQPSLPDTPLTYPQALAYLRGEALVLPPSTPRGIVTVSFEGHPLGMVKNIGTRANNLYPKEWRIKTTHIPTEYEAILRHT